MERFFRAAVEVNGSLQTKMNASDDPAGFAYEEGKKYLASFQSNIKPETIKDTVEDPTETRNNSATEAPSLASATAQASNSNPVEKDESLNEMFADQSY
jgi:hypothetical protein